MKRPVTALCFCLFTLGGSTAFATEPVRVHVSGGGAQAVGGTTGSDFSTGAAGAATVELPASARIGFQATGGAIVLSKGESSDPTMVRTSTGAAFMGTAGMRLRAFGEGHPGGPWVDGNFGVARTGDLTRPAVDAHIGWDIRVSSTSRVDVGPYVGYTQIFQPDASLRGDDARILTAGLSVSLGAKAAPKSTVPAIEAPPPAPPVLVSVDHDPEELAEAVDVCPDGMAPSNETCTVGEIRIFENRILLEDVIHFEFGKAKIRQPSFRVVKKLAKFIIEHDEIVDVSIEGHTDEVGSDAFNQTLSVERATAMRELLVWFGAPAKQLRVVGYGKSNPKIVTLKPEEANRRVELFVTVTKAEASNSGASMSHEKSSR